MTWFEELTGFREESPAQVRAHLSVAGTMLRSRGKRETDALRRRLSSLSPAARMLHCPP